MKVNKSDDLKLLMCTLGTVQQIHTYTLAPRLGEGAKPHWPPGSDVYAYLTLTIMLMYGSEGAMGKSIYPRTDGPGVYLFYDTTNQVGPDGAVLIVQRHKCGQNLSNSDVPTVAVVQVWPRRGSIAVLTVSVQVGPVYCMDLICSSIYG